MNNKYSVATTEKEARQQILNIMENYSKNMDEMLEFLKFQVEVLSVFRSEHHVNLYAKHGSDALPVF